MNKNKINEAGKIIILITTLITISSTVLITIFTFRYLVSAVLFIVPVFIFYYCAKYYRKMSKTECTDCHFNYAGVCAVDFKSKDCDSYTEDEAYEIKA